jgi:hypothetical protein
MKSTEGSTLSSSNAFDSQADAELWLTGHWATAVDEGADSVVLMAGDDVVYEMSLHPEDPS